MVNFPSGSSELLRAAEALCAQHSSVIASDAVDEPSAVAVARRILTDTAAQNSSTTAGLTESVVPSLRIPAGSAAGQSSGHTPRRATMTPRSTLKGASPLTNVMECPYCTDSRRRFCPESGRRHETKEERARRFWRTIVRQTQFSRSMASTTRLAQENTCAEEFYIEM